MSRIEESQYYYKKRVGFQVFSSHKMRLLQPYGTKRETNKVILHIGGITELSALNIRLDNITKILGYENNHLRLMHSHVSSTLYVSKKCYRNGNR